MPCTGRYAEANDFGTFWCLGTLSAQETATIEAFLDIAASDMHAALAAADACSCTLASWADGFLKKLNMIDAAVIHNCPCGSANLSDGMKQTWLRWVSEQLTAIATGKLELCQGATASAYPSIGWAELNLTEFNEARILLNRELRTP